MLKIPDLFCGESVLLAVSGGIDSMVMAGMFDRSRHLFPWNVSPGGMEVAVAHCNFHLRGEESDGDARFVENWAVKHGMRFFRNDFDTLSFASEHGVSIEMAARELRYRWFDKLCVEYGFRGVCVAHNANDNAETLFLNLLRGTGIKGLCGLRDITVNAYGKTLVLRPMLAMSRDDIEQYARENSIPFRTDSTNLENDCSRNIIRNEVFPLLKKINPSFIRTVNSDIGNFNEAESVVQAYFSEHSSTFRNKSAHDAESPLRLEYREINATGFPGCFLHLLLSGYGFNSSAIKDVAGVVADGAVSGRKWYSENHVLLTTSDGITVMKREEYEGDGALEQVRVELLDWDSATMSPVAPRGVLYLDASKLGGEPIIRKWQAGDWMIPLGMKGKKKVSDLLTDLKYDLARKNRTLVVAGKDRHVLAVVGARIDDSVRIDGNTTRIYRITML